MSTYKKLVKQRMLLLLISISLFPVFAAADTKYDELKAQVDLLQNQLMQVQSVLKEYEKQSVNNSKEVK